MASLNKKKFHEKNKKYLSIKKNKKKEDHWINEKQAF